MADHETNGQSDEWYTPPWVFDALRVEFQCDPFSPGAEAVPWIPAIEHGTKECPLEVWRGSVWLNPPYGGRNGIIPSLRDLAEYGDGIALVPNRTGAGWFQDYAQWADGLLFVRKKIRFLRPDGSEGVSPGYGNVFMAFGPKMRGALRSSGIRGLRF